MPEKNKEIKEEIKAPVQEKEKFSLKKIPTHNWAIATYIFAIITVVLAVTLFSGNPGLTGNVISETNMETLVDDFVNTQLVEGGGATIESIKQESGLYVATVNLDGQSVPLYFTKDGKFISPGRELMAIKSTETTASEDIPKSDKPAVELYVMSFCPYGVNAEGNILPIAELLKNKIDFKIRYIVTVNGNTINDVSSLHGINEAKEDARQLMIMKYYPDKFYSYLKDFNANCYPVASDSAKLDVCWKAAAAKLNIDTNKIETAAYGTEGLNALKVEQADDEKYSVSGSPTLMINGIQSTSIYSGTGATQTAICSAFNSMPSECGQTIASSNSSTTTSGSC